MKAIDLFQLTRAVNSEKFGLFERILSEREKKIDFRSHEKKSLHKLVTLLYGQMAVENFKHFYFSFDIPQIGKEFDLLRFNDDSIINIELKSSDVGEEKILKQLLQNRHYLSHLDRKITSYTFVANRRKVYHLTAEGELEVSTIEALATDICSQTDCYTDDINALFQASDFLISPLNDPEKFLDKKYFLTSDQEGKKKAIISAFSNEGDGFSFIGLTGSPGTGKTLALYDLAVDYASKNKVCMIHCGNLSEGHDELNAMLKHMDIYPIKQIDQISFAHYRYLFVDESHRLGKDQFELLVSQVKSNQIKCLFSYDEQQVLSRTEIEANITKQILELPHFKEHQLSKKVRTNPEMASFIRKLFDRNFKDGQSAYPSVSLSYANNKDEARLFIKAYQSQDYTFINYTPSIYADEVSDSFQEDLNTHETIGLEFDHVVMVVDRTFFYDEKGLLVAADHPNPNYLYSKLLYHGLTRVRRKLALVILDNEEFFQSLLDILDGTTNKDLSL